MSIEMKEQEIEKEKHKENRNDTYIKDLKEAIQRDKDRIQLLEDGYDIMPESKHSFKPAFDVTDSTCALCHKPAYDRIHEFK